MRHGDWWTHLAMMNGKLINYFEQTDYISLKMKILLRKVYPWLIMDSAICIYKLLVYEVTQEQEL